MVVCFILECLLLLVSDEIMNTRLNLHVLAENNLSSNIVAKKGIIFVGNRRSLRCLHALQQQRPTIFQSQSLDADGVEESLYFEN